MAFSNAINQPGKAINYHLGQAVLFQMSVSVHTKKLKSLKRVLALPSSLSERTVDEHSRSKERTCV